MTKNLISGMILGQIWVSKIFFVAFNFTGKLMRQTWEKDKKPNFGPDSGSF